MQQQIMQQQRAIFSYSHNLVLKTKTYMHNTDVAASHKVKKQPKIMQQQIKQSY